MEWLGTKFFPSGKVKKIKIHPWRSGKLSQSLLGRGGPRMKGCWGGQGRDHHGCASKPSD